MSYFVAAQLLVCSPSELGLLARVGFIWVCTSAQGMRDHRGCFRLRAEADSRAGAGSSRGRGEAGPLLSVAVSA